MKSAPDICLRARAGMPAGGAHRTSGRSASERDAAAEPARNTPSPSVPRTGGARGRDFPSVRHLAPRSWRRTVIDGRQPNLTTTVA